jgi:hypothetical protein
MKSYFHPAEKSTILSFRVDLCPGVNYIFSDPKIEANNEEVDYGGNGADGDQLPPWLPPGNT